MGWGRGERDRETERETERDSGGNGMDFLSIKAHAQ